MMYLYYTPYRRKKQEEFALQILFFCLLANINKLCIKQIEARVKLDKVVNKL